MIKCVFFDRDGVLIKNYGYLNDISKLKWLNGTLNSIKILNKKKIRVVVVTNQSGIARGFFTEQELKKFHNGMNYILKLIKKKQLLTLFLLSFPPKWKNKKYKKKVI